MPTEARRKRQFPGTNWSFRWLWVTLWMLGIKPETSGGAASVLNHWATAPAPKVHPLMSFVFPQWLLVVDLLCQINKELSWQAEVARGFPGWLWRNSVLLLVMEAGARSCPWKAHVWEADRRLSCQLPTWRMLCFQGWTSDVHPSGQREVGEKKVGPGVLQSLPKSHLLLINWDLHSTGFCGKEKHCTHLLAAHSEICFIS